MTLTYSKKSAIFTLLFCSLVFSLFIFKIANGDVTCDGRLYLGTNVCPPTSKPPSSVTNPFDVNISGGTGAGSGGGVNIPIGPKDYIPPTTDRGGTCNYFGDHTGYPNNPPTCPPTDSPTKGTQKTADNRIITIQNPLKSTNITDLIKSVTTWLLYIAVPIMTLMIIIGAFQILTAAGNAEQVTTGRKTVTYAIIGYILLLLSTGVVSIISELLGKK